MPHRPERQATTASTSASSIFKQHVVAPTSMQGNNSAARIMRPTAQTSLQSSGVYPSVVTPMMNATGQESQKPWISAHAGMINRSMMQTKSTDSADNRSISTKHDEECTVATLATEATADEMERREATASALLMVSAQTTRHDASVTCLQDEKEASNENQEGTTVPLKKRKKHLDFLRKNQETEETPVKHQDPCHISPMSHSSIGSAHVDGRTVSKEEVTPDRPIRPSGLPARSSSYDSKESPVRPVCKSSTQALLDSSKIVNTDDITPPAHVVVPHFPSVLHGVISSQEFGDTVLQWLPDGESWKVLRWDALRRQVLPKYFADLRDEHGRGSGTIDAFLWHLTAWGFEEVKDGTDVGAYRHDLFIRGAQKLCSKMRFTAVPSDDDGKALGPNTVSPTRTRASGDRTLLQVPSLKALTRPVAKVETPKPESPSKRPRYAEPPNVEAVRRPSPSTLNWPMAYRPGEHYTDTSAWGHYYSESHMGMRHSGHSATQYPGSSYDPRIHMRHVASDTLIHHSTQYSPPQVRSGRGSMRIATGRISANSSPGNTPAARHNFPVSNRGKGPRKPTPCRPMASATPVPALSERSSPVEMALAAEAHRVGSSVKGVAVAISRKTKRKLPMAMKHEKGAAGFDGEI